MRGIEAGNAARKKTRNAAVPRRLITTGARCRWALAALAAAGLATAESPQRGALDYQSQPDAGTGDRQPAIVWRFHAAGPVRNAPDLHDGVLYVPSADGYVHALDADSGLPLWERDLDAAPGAAVAYEELLVLMDRRNRVHALERASGATRWMRETGPDRKLKWGKEGWDYLIPAPAIRDGVVYAGSGDGGLYALDSENGSVRWKYQTGGRIRATPALHDGVVYVGSGDGYFHAVDAASGERVWRFATEGVDLHGADFGFDRTQITGSANVTDGAVYFGSRDARLYALDRQSGRELWRVEEPSAWVIATPVVTPDVIYSARSSSAQVRAVDRASGDELWQRAANSPVFASPVIVGNRLYIASEAGTLYAFDRTSGRELWAMEAGASIWGTPVAHDGRLYFGSDGGTVYALTDHGRKLPALAVVWDENLLARSSQGQDPRKARLLVSELVSRGYQVLSLAALRAFLTDPEGDPSRSVVVFAMDGLPLPDVDTDSAFSRFLESGGTAVWLGRPPGIVMRDEAGAFQRLAPEAPARLLGVPFDAWNGDRYPAARTAAGERRGLPAFWTASPSIGGPAAGIEILALDEFGRPAAWARHYGGRSGSGFVYLGNLWEQVGACTIARVAGHALTSGGFAAGAPACDRPE
jgi:eukaryotic-like serine/threonine-protein kinase